MTPSATSSRRGVRAERGHLAAAPLPVAPEDLHRRAPARSVKPGEAEGLAPADRQADPPTGVTSP
ncbi:hypothetical protein [Streptomyces sp. H27-H5]|uniref:hypothetical protein n=1 Tax=Streptomyces sp. H27-H5 TaxID=2996460 RepID=UPI00226FDD04|nr:hypothetical protein [Streptomyces sp. H27-H5]MCY0960673.1 hypothetical protein [Streptomyces sp. H27-H5]